MDFEFSPKTQALQAKLLAFMDEQIYPAEAAYHAEIIANTAAGKRWTPLQTIEKLKVKAQSAGLWNQRGVRSLGRNHGPRDVV
jgi:acyl-CoA dehydrogenase